MRPDLPRILSPNLGCPVIRSPEEIQVKGFDVVTVEHGQSKGDSLALRARPSWPGEGLEFSLKFTAREILPAGTLPNQFERIEETRFLISTTLRSRIFADQADFFPLSGGIRQLSPSGNPSPGERPAPVDPV